MARLATLSAGLIRDHTRGLLAHGGMAGNNLVLAMILLAVAGSPVAFLVAVVGLPLLLAMASEGRPEQAERLALLPLSNREHALLRWATRLADPVVALLVILGLLAGRRGVAVVGSLLLAVLATRLVSNRWRHRSPGPSFHLTALPGPCTGLLGVFLGGMLRTLDFYAALLVAAAGLLYRIETPVPHPAALMGASLMVTLCLSTCTQRLFAPEGPQGLARLRLLPLRGWHLLLLKDTAFLLILLPLVSPFSLSSGLAGGLVSLGLGHLRSLRPSGRPQRPWQFLTGTTMGFSAVQVSSLFVAGIVAQTRALWVLPLCLILNLATLAWAGRRMERPRPGG